MYTRGWCVIGRGGWISPRNHLNWDTHTHTHTHTLMYKCVYMHIYTLIHWARMCVYVQCVRALYMNTAVSSKITSLSLGLIVIFDPQSATIYKDSWVCFNHHHIFLFDSPTTFILFFLFHSFIWEILKCPINVINTKRKKRFIQNY